MLGRKREGSGSFFFFPFLPRRACHALGGGKEGGPSMGCRGSTPSRSGISARPRIIRPLLRKLVWGKGERGKGERERFLVCAVLLPLLAFEVRIGRPILT